MNNNPITINDPLGDTAINGKLFEPKDASHATTLTDVIVIAPQKIKQPTGLDGIIINLYDPSRRKINKLGQGGIYIVGHNGAGMGIGTPSNAGDPQPVNIDLLLSTFSMVNKAGALKPPDFSDPWDALKLFGKITKQVGTDANKLPGSNETNTYEPNSKIAPTQTWYDGRNQGYSGDTSTHPERKYASPIYITDSLGKPISIVTGTGTNTSDTIPY